MDIISNGFASKLLTNHQYKVCTKPAILSKTNPSSCTRIVTVPRLRCSSCHQRHGWGTGALPPAPSSPSSATVPCSWESLPPKKTTTTPHQVRPQLVSRSNLQINTQQRDHSHRFMVTHTDPFSVLRSYMLVSSLRSRSGCRTTLTKPHRSGGGPNKGYGCTHLRPITFSKNNRS